MKNCSSRNIITTVYLKCRGLANNVSIIMKFGICGVIFVYMNTYLSKY